MGSRHADPRAFPARYHLCGRPKPHHAMPHVMHPGVQSSLTRVFPLKPFSVMLQLDAYFAHTEGISPVETAHTAHFGGFCSICHAINATETWETSKHGEVHRIGYGGRHVPYMLRMKCQREAAT